MVLELLIKPKKAERTPWEMFFIGLAYASIAILLSVWIFSENISLVMVFLATLSCTYLVQGTMRLEEKKDERIRKETKLLKEHTKALSLFMFLFLGFSVAFSLWYIFTPAELNQKIFELQISTINSINSNVSGNFSNSSNVFNKILINNIKVLFFSFLFAFFYGAGAIFILAWNAAVVGTAIGSFARSGLGLIAQDLGLSSIGNYLSIYSLSLMRYLTHGWLEILAYFTAALAGGIISIAIIRHDVRSPEFRTVLFDSINLALISMIMLVAAAAVEVYITPILF
ncbi:stage II sporulation protein M [Candidatus Woesearchaeota archaeon]|nr:stage II sporulation protein M [Candidatus Woesearchaeota archaeon]